MTLILDALRAIATDEIGRGGDVLDRLGEHLLYTVLAVLLASVIAVPLGYLIGHTGRGRTIAVALSGAARALPTFGLLFGLALLLGIGLLPGLTVFVLLAIPPILAGAYAGVEAVDRATVDAARAMGLTEWQILLRVEAPLGLPLLLGGLRSATLQVVATATLASFIGLGGLGGYIQSGLSLRDFTQMLAGAILVTALALALELVFAVLQRIVVPRGVVAAGGRNASRRSSRPRAVAGTPAASREGRS